MVLSLFLSLVGGIYIERLNVSTKALAVNILLLLLPASGIAQHTFSIVAVDSTTGQVGSAGATCLQDTSSSTSSAVIISDVHPGRGVIHTQAYYLSYNQQTARDRMNQGDSPKEIIHYVLANDFLADTTIRQYGIVDFDNSGSPRAAAYTGDSTLPCHGHIVGPHYTIQGNTLNGQGVLDSMKARFLSTNGSLADKLMAALRGAKWPGADRRCASEGVSSQSAFLRIADPNDAKDDMSLNLVVPSTPYGQEPIDSLHCLLRQSKGLSCDATSEDDTTNTSMGKKSSHTHDVQVIPNPVYGNAALSLPERLGNREKFIRIYNACGKEVRQYQSNSLHLTLSTKRLQEGIYFIQVITPQEEVSVRAYRFVVH